MAKAKKVPVEQEVNVPEVSTPVQEEQYEGPITHESANPVPEVETTPTVPALNETSPEIIERRAKEKDLEASLLLIKTDLKNLRNEIKALLTGTKVKAPRTSAHKYVFISNGQDPKDMKTAKGKALSYQGRLLIELFIKGAPEGTELSYSRDEVIDILEKNYPCAGDKMDNFSWYKSQIFKPMGLVK